MRHALISRIIIEQATGMIAERGGLDMAAAFNRVRTYTRSTNQRLRNVAEFLISGELDANVVLETRRPSTPAPKRR